MTMYTGVTFSQTQCIHVYTQKINRSKLSKLRNLFRYLVWYDWEKFCWAGGGVGGANKQMLEPQSSDSRLLSQCMAVGRSYSSSDWQHGSASSIIYPQPSRLTDSDTLVIKPWQRPTCCSTHPCLTAVMLCPVLFYVCISKCLLFIVYLAISIMISNEFLLLNVNILSCLKMIY